MANAPGVGGVVGGVVVGVLILTIGLLSVSLKKLDSTQVGLMYDTIAKSLGKTPYYEGLHNGAPGFEFIVFPSNFRSMEYGGVQCLNKDGVEITLSITFQYRISGAKILNIVEQFRDFDEFKNVLYPIGESTIHESCCLYNTSQFQAERGAFQETIRTRLVKNFAKIFTDITDVQVNNIRRPRQYENSVKGKESAREDIIVARNERPRQLTEAETVLRQAETLADITTDKAESDSRISKSKALAQAAAILDRYQQESDAYKSLVSSSGLNLNTQGFLAYLGVRVIEEAKNPVYIGMKAPAKASYMTT